VAVCRTVRRDPVGRAPLPFGDMVSIELITPKTAGVFKAVRLRALQDSPSAFGSTYARESAFSDEEWRRRAGRPTEEAALYMAEDDGEPCGLARGSRDREDPLTSWLESMWVAPTHRQGGVGRGLVEAVASWAAGRGCRTLKLMVTCNNSAAIGFYGRLGFSRTGRTGPYPNDPAVVEWEMARPVP